MGILSWMIGGWEALILGGCFLVVLLGIAAIVFVVVFTSQKAKQAGQKTNKASSDDVPPLPLDVTRGGGGSD